MICEHATEHDFQRWATHAQTLDAYALRYIVTDCQKAAAGMRDWNPAREGYYLDQASTYGMELTRRNRNLPPALRYR